MFPFWTRRRRQTSRRQPPAAQTEQPRQRDLGILRQYADYESLAAALKTGEIAVFEGYASMSNMGFQPPPVPKRVHIKDASSFDVLVSELAQGHLIETSFYAIPAHLAPPSR